MLTPLSRLLLIIAAGTAAGCSALPVPIGVSGDDDALIWTDAGELATLKSLYDYAAELSTLDAAQRQERLDALNAVDLDRLDVSQRLRLALLLSDSGGRADYAAAIAAVDSARQELDDAPLLSAYAIEQIARYRQLDTISGLVSGLDADYRLLLQQYQDTRRRLSRRTPPARGPASDPDPDTDRDIGVDIDSDVDSDELIVSTLRDAGAGAAETPSDRPSDSVWRLYAERMREQADRLRRDLQQKDAIIAAQDGEITSLEAKIKALSAIERNLNQRDE